MGIIHKLTWGRRRRLRRWYHREKSALVKVRILVVTRLAEGASSVDIGEGLHALYSNYGGRSCLTHHRHAGEYGDAFAFTGHITRVTLDLSGELIPDTEADLKIAITRQ